MVKPVVLSNGRSWKTQTAAKDHFRAIRDRYPLNTPIDNYADHADLAALLERHDNAHPDEESKIGCGIDYFEVRNNYGAGGTTQGFWVVRTDGSATDFSFPWAIRGIPKPQAQEFLDACRSAVLSDIRAAKRRFFDMHADAEGRVPCDVSGIMISGDEAHVDHAHPTFVTLVITFRAAQGWHQQIPAGLLSVPTDKQFNTTFADEAVLQRFRDYHKAAASLRVISKEINLAAAAGQRRPKIQRPVTL